MDDDDDDIGYTAIALESRCLLASVHYDKMDGDDLTSIMMISKQYYDDNLDLQYTILLLFKYFEYLNTSLIL